MTDNKNTFLAIVLSAIVLLAWQYFVGMPQMEKQRQAQQQQQQQQAQKQTTPGAPPAPGTAAPGTPAAPGAPQAGAPSTPGGQVYARDTILAASRRIAIDTPRLKGSIALKGARIDDISLTQYRETVNPRSPAIVLLSPSGSEHPFYAELGWTPGAGVTAKVPDSETVWRQEGTGALTPTSPVTLTWDNGEGLQFRRTISVDQNYLISATDEVKNTGTAPLTLVPYALISRHGTPKTEGYYILHEGPIGILEDKLQEKSYKELEEKKAFEFPNTKGWLGFTDKYWAVTLMPDAKTNLQKARFLGWTSGNQKYYQADYSLDAQTIAPGATGSATARLFAGAKEVNIVDGYNDGLGLDRFDRLIDWGWFYYITKPMFKAIDYFFRWTGNFGLAILIVTVLVKLLFFPLANKSYASMAKMKAVQPEMMAIRDRYGDDKMKQQQALMELYKKEKINPLAGCLPILVQIPVFFALYKVLFITIEMRHAPFYGWIKDLSAQDPTNLFSLFGLLPEPSAYLGVAIGSFFHLGIWPIVMGITMFLQMKLNPSPPDPTQKMIFDWMPLIFTFMLASFSAGLVIYWAWNNTLSVLQQAFIMNKHGAKIELWDNVKELFVKKKEPEKKEGEKKDTDKKNGDKSKKK